MNTDWIIAVVAVAFYAPSIAYLLHTGASWVEIVVVGVILTILCSGLNRWLPPWGAVVFVTVHLIMTGVGVSGIVEERRGCKQ